MKVRKVKMRPQLRFKGDNHFFRGGSQSNKRAIHLVEKALKKGILIRPSVCQVCKKPSTLQNGRSGIEGHHEDYRKPLDVMWLCQKCHFTLHESKKSATKG